MGDPSQHSQSHSDSVEISDRRRLSRYPGNARVLIYRTTDMMRREISGNLKDVSLGGIGLLTKEPFAADESLSVTLINEVQRVNKQVAGIVRHVTNVFDDVHHVGIELTNRLTPAELGLLCMGIPKEADGAGTTWA